MSENEDMSERRRFPFRPETSNLVYFSLLDENNFLLTQGMGKTINISRGGALLEVYKALNENNRILLSIGMEDEVLELEALIVYFKKITEKIWHLGINFSEMTGPQAKLLSRYIEKFELKQR